MYDVILLENLKSFKAGADNIYELQNRYRDIIKIIKNRTKDKLYLLHLMKEYNFVDTDVYNELLKRVQYDYKSSLLYLIGRVQL